MLRDVRVTYWHNVWMTNQTTGAPAVATKLCRQCRKVPAMCRCRGGGAPETASARPAASQPMRREVEPDVAPQVAGLVLPDDVLMLAQAAAGDADMVEWFCALVRASVTPLASSVTLKGTYRDVRTDGVTDAPDAAPLTAAQRQAKRRAALAADPEFKAAEAARAKANRIRKAAEKAAEKGEQ